MYQFKNVHHKHTSPKQARRMTRIHNRFSRNIQVYLVNPWLAPLQNSIMTWYVFSSIRLCICLFVYETTLEPSETWYVFSSIRLCICLFVYETTLEPSET